MEGGAGCTRPSLQPLVVLLQQSRLGETVTGRVAALRDLTSCSSAKPANTCLLKILWLRAMFAAGCGCITKG